MDPYLRFMEAGKMAGFTGADLVKFADEKAKQEKQEAKKKARENRKEENVRYREICEEEQEWLERLKPDPEYWKEEMAEVQARIEEFEKKISLNKYADEAENEIEARCMDLIVDNEEEESDNPEKVEDKVNEEVDGNIPTANESPKDSEILEEKMLEHEERDQEESLNTAIDNEEIGNDDAEVSNNVTNENVRSKDLPSSDGSVTVVGNGRDATRTACSAAGRACVIDDGLPGDDEDGSDSDPDKKVAGRIMIEKEIEEDAKEVFNRSGVIDDGSIKELHGEGGDDEMIPSYNSTQTQWAREVIFNPELDPMKRRQLKSLLEGFDEQHLPPEEHRCLSDMTTGTSVKGDETRERGTFRRHHAKFPRGIRDRGPSRDCRMTLGLLEERA